MGRPVKNLLGTHFGELTVVEFVDVFEERARWRVRCACGALFIIFTRHLQQGSVQRCKACRKAYQTKIHLKDLQGLRFYNLTVIEFVDVIDGHARWLVRCDCGTEFVSLAYSFKRGNVRRCKTCRGQDRAERYCKDETGNVYTQLTVLSRADSRGGEWYWKCICTCGNIRDVRGSHLRAGTIKRCAVCGAKESAKANTTHGMTKTPEYARARNSRREERKLNLDGEWTHLMDIALRAFFSQCVLCPSTGPFHVDHVYPLHLGYGLKPGNAVILCKDCNLRKQGTHPDKLPEEIRTKLLSAAERFRVAWSGGW